MFFGREDVFSFVRRHLIGRHRDNPIVLYGQRRTGKTSVLYQLHRHLDPSYLCIFIDLQGLSLDGMGNLLLDIANSVSRGLQRDHQLSVRVPDPALFLTDPRKAFETIFLEAVWPVLGENHLVLMVDEVVRLQEEITAGRLEREIFEYLRHLMQHHPRLDFIFSLGSGLEDMTKEYAFLFSVSLYHPISFLETAAANELITNPVRDCYQVKPKAVRKILQITSGHPYYTQLICHCLFDRWIRSPKPVMTVEDVNAVLAEAIELGSANLKYVWEESTPEEQAVMAGMVAAMGTARGRVTIKQIRKTWRDVSVSLPEREAANAVRSLTRREVVTGDPTYSFAVDLQRMWLDKHRRLDWVKEDLTEAVREWDRSIKAGPPTWTRARVWIFGGVSVGMVLIGVLIPVLVVGSRSTPPPTQSSTPPPTQPSPTQQVRTAQITDPSDRSQVADGTVVLGKINSLRIIDGTIVSNTCWTAGCSASLSSSERTIWIVTEAVANQRFYPQGSWPDEAGPVLINSVGEWVSPPVFMGTTPRGAAILIMAMLVTHKEEDVFKAYLEKGYATGKYAGLTRAELPEGEDILDTVMVFRK